MRDFNHTVNVLVKAFFNETLQHGNCHACAVGNIVAHANNFSYKPNPIEDECEIDIVWGHKKGYYVSNTGDLDTTWHGILHGFGSDRTPDEGLRQIKSTGYSSEELRFIEKAFERCRWTQEPMFSGLMAVVDVLADIHGIDLQAKEEAKLLFVKA